MENMYTDVRVNLKKVGPDVTSTGHAAIFLRPIKYQIQWVCELVSSTTCFAFSLELTDFKTRRVQQFRKNMVSRHLK